jgi:hypothetical protein
VLIFDRAGITDTDYTETDKSADNDNYYSAESSIASDGDGDDEEDAESITDNNELYSCNHSPLLLYRALTFIQL